MEAGDVMSGSRWLRQAPAFVGIAILAIVSVTFGVSGKVPRTTEVESRHAEIEKAFGRIPARLQSSATWLRRKEVPIPTGQIEILGDVAFASLEYQRLGSSPPLLATLFIVHCRDARTMSGHHPPVCYPASGWSLQEEVLEDRITLASGLELRLAAYRFQRGSLGRTLTVVNGFLVPGAGPVRFVEDAIGSVNTLTQAALGVSQFQVLLSGRIPIDDALGYTKEILGGLDEGMFEILLESSSPSLERAEPTAR